MPRNGRLVLVGLVGALLGGCGKGDDAAKAGSPRPAEESSANGAAADFEKQAEATRRSLAELNGGRDIKAVDPKELKALLPDAIAGAKRGKVESQHQAAMGMDISTTEATYEVDPAPEGDPVAGYQIKITDVGNMSGTTAAGYAVWSMGSYEKTTENGWEKSSKIKGFPALEKYDREARQGSYTVFVAKRFMVEVDGHDATIEQVRAALDALDLGKLESLAR